MEIGFRLISTSGHHLYEKVCGLVSYLCTKPGRMTEEGNQGVVSISTTTERVNTSLVSSWHAYSKTRVHGAPRTRFGVFPP
jgi:hypothetical protein